MVFLRRGPPPTGGALPTSFVAAAERSTNPVGTGVQHRVVAKRAYDRPRVKPGPASDITPLDVG